MVNQWTDDHVCLRGKEASNGIGSKCNADNTRKDKTKANKKGKCNMSSQVDIKKKSISFFYKKKGHIKKKCVKYKKWLERKCVPISFVYYEYNMVDVNYNTWWIDYDSTIHISNTFSV